MDSVLERFEELILGYLNGELTESQRQEFFALMLRDARLIAVLRHELELAKRLRKLKREMPDSMRERVRQQAIAGRRSSMAKQVVQVVLRSILPPEDSFPTFILRSVFR